MQFRRAVDAVRRPEYTGENRCRPCTLLNLALVAAAALGVGFLGEPTVAVAVAVLGVGLIYVRGYVVPGTPVLTQTLLPESVLRWFEHGASPGPDQSASHEDVAFDPETALVEAGALEPCQDRDDLCLDSLFRTEWHSKMSAAADDVDAALYHILPPSVDEPVAVEHRRESVVARVDGATVAEWPSRAAFVADAAGAATLEDADPNWPNRDFAERTRLLAGLRLWLDRCAVCDGHVQLGEDTVESCCRSVPVVAASCTSCGARIFEAPHPEE
jgi:hypothetical protein